ncbi:hypothetical protein HYALB_00007670 [Hymenoscyphus albidus]|uniref:MYND-type domain-containing protein n=1 Tax=Hymenoscyphus albidus TaxID=595503 RepID=A0A9N9L9G9_9HELO|nr:hypothetical protein HYALB_00007670 [Hymenoscyphus albidus]
MSLNEASSSEPPAKRITRADDSVPAQSSQECSICRCAARFGCLYCSSAPYCSIACLEIGQATHGSLCQQLNSFMTGSVVGIGSIYKFDWENNALLKLLEDRTHLPGDAPLVGVKLSRKHVKNHEPYGDITTKDLEMVAESRTWQGKFLGRSEVDQANGLLAGNSLYESV